jgi:hypothetical protein
VGASLAKNGLFNTPVYCFAMLQVHQLLEALQHSISIAGIILYLKTINQSLILQLESRDMVSYPQMVPIETF